MKRFLEKSTEKAPQSLEHMKEMATLYAKEMIIEVYNDHGEIGNSKNPAHAHTCVRKYTIAKKLILFRFLLLKALKN